MLRKIEKFVAKALNNNIKLKQFIKHIYTLPFIFVGSFIFRTNLQGKSIHFGEIGKESFLGYYDIAPDNKDGLVLCHQTANSTFLDPNAEKKLKLHYFILISLLIQFLAQKPLPIIGNRVADFSGFLIINLFLMIMTLKKIYIYSRIIDINDFNKEQVVQKPIQTLINDNEFLSLNYSRLAALRPDYGYFNIDEAEIDLEDYINDGIWKVDIKNEKETLLYSLENIINLDYQNHFSLCKHKINHLMMSPNKKNFLILHRIFEGNKRTGRLILGDIAGSSLKLLPSDKMVSHYTWLDDNKVLAYLSMHDNEDAYYVINVNNLNYTKPKNLNTIANGDGHPTLIDENNIITDTYPDRYGYQKIFMYNYKNDKVSTIGSVKHYRKYKLVNRCDLHPKPSRSKNYFFFDSVFTGKRRLHKLKISDDIINK